MAQACNPSAKKTRGSLGSLPANQSTPSAKLQANKRLCLKEGGCVFCGQPKVGLHIHRYKQKDFYIIW